MRPGNRFALSLALLSIASAGAAAQSTVRAVPVPLDLKDAATTASAYKLAASAPESIEISSSSEGTAALPDSPSFLLAGDTSSDAGTPGYQSGKGGVATSGAPIAPKYATTILPGQSGQPLSAGDKVVFGLRNTVSPFTLLTIMVSAGWSQGINSAPHYIDNPFAKRIGAAAARNSIQTLAGQALFSPLFHDDPRYYVLGRQHKLLNRAVYAATRVIVTRSDSGHNRVNAPLLLSYAVAAAANNAYYPERDRGGKETATNYASSLGGAVLGMEVSEFLNDALHLVHLRRD